MSQFKINLIKSPFVNERDTKQKLADFILNADRFSMGSECKKFEQQFSKKQGREYSVYVNSGSSANLALIQALMNLGRLKKGGRVGISAITWATNVMPLIQLGLNPVAIDCELSSLNISSAKLEEHISSLDALFLTNVLGFADDVVEIKRVCSEHGVTLLEDNCESLGSKVGGTLLGNFGLASTFSFFLGHHISTLEGGMICTDDEELYNMLSITRAHGWDRSLETEQQEDLRDKHHVDSFYSIYTFYDLAFNVRPNRRNGLKLPPPAIIALIAFCCASVGCSSGKKLSAPRGWGSSATTSSTSPDSTALKTAWRTPLLTS